MLLIDVEDALNEIHAVLNDETLPGEVLKALQTLWKYVDTQDKLRIGTKRNYLRYARAIFRRLPIHPKKWTHETIIAILEGFRRKPNGEDYSTQYRNIIRIVLRYILSAFGLKELNQLCDDESTKIGEQMKLQRIQKPVEQFETVEIISENHMKAIASQIPTDRVRTLIWVLWDIGARPDDVKMMTLNDVEFDESGTGIVLWVPAETKTGRRPTRPRYSLPMLRKYLAEHPFGIRNRDGSFK
ncbi:MAG: hypothetical protein ACXADF_05290, partial [Candidatus Thorarchaeota archaeon]